MTRLRSYLDWLAVRAALQLERYGLREWLVFAAVVVGMSIWFGSLESLVVSAILLAVFYVLKRRGDHLLSTGE